MNNSTSAEVSGHEIRCAFPRPRQGDGNAIASIDRPVTDAEYNGTLWERVAESGHGHIRPRRWCHTCEPCAAANQHQQPFWARLTRTTR